MAKANILVQVVCNRDYTLRTTKGITESFKAGVAKGIHPRILDDAMAVGIVPVDGQPVGGEPEVAPPPAAGSEERAVAIKAKMQELLERNGDGDFTTAGNPNRKALKAELGFDVSADENTVLWAEVKASQED